LRGIFFHLYKLLFITGFSSSQAWSNEFLKGIYAYQESDYKTAYNYFLPLARGRDDRAQYRQNRQNSTVNRE
jgi:hypothetical protein